MEYSAVRYDTQFLDYTNELSTINRVYDWACLEGEMIGFKFLE